MSSSNDSHLTPSRRKTPLYRFLTTILGLLPLLLLAGCSYFIVFPMLWDLVLFPRWVDLAAPHPSPAKLRAPRLLDSGLASSSVYWFRDGSALLLVTSDYSGQGLPAVDHPTATIVNAQTGMILDQKKFESDSKLDDTYSATVKLYTRWLGDTLWGSCPSKNLSVRGVPLYSTAWEVDLEQSNTVLGRFSLQPTQWINADYPPRPGGFAFSPDCSQFVLTLEGQIYADENSQGEMWLLDVPSRSFSRVLLGQWAAFHFVMYPAQSVTPDWSPDGTELVFGNEDFGLETFNPRTRQRHWLVAPAYAGHTPMWSASGQWIAAVREWSSVRTIQVFSRDGQTFAITDNCYDWDGALTWAPSDDRLAYLCQEPNRSNTASYSLWIWSMSNNP
jgi:hypothetical protein